MINPRGKNADESTFRRCPHDAENPYTMISNALIRDHSISPDCRWLIIRLLSNSGDWVIRAAQLIKELEGHWGRNKVYRTINEAIAAGYVHREQKRTGKFGGVEYFVSETPKFKKFRPLPQNGDAVPLPQNGDTKERTNRLVGIVLKKEKETRETSPSASDRAAPFSNSNKNSEENKKMFTKGHFCPHRLDRADDSGKKPSPPRHPPDKPPKDEFSPDVQRLVKHFVQALSFNPKLKIPADLRGWMREFDRMIRLDGHTPEEIQIIIDKTFKDHFWCVNIRSPAKLREKFAQLWGQFVLRPKPTQHGEKRRYEESKPVKKHRAPDMSFTSPPLPERKDE